MCDALATVKVAKVKSVCKCPACGQEFVKKSYQHTFCSNKGVSNCKDRYWNSAVEARRNYAGGYYTNGPMTELDEF